MFPPPSSQNGISYRKTTSFTSNTVASGTGAWLQSTLKLAALLATCPIQDPIASTLSTYVPGPSGRKVSLLPDMTVALFVYDGRHSMASDSSRSGGGGGGGGDGGGGGKSYLRIHKGMLSSIAFGSTTGAGGADGSTHGLYGTGTVGAGACVMYHRCVTNGLSQKLSGTVVLTRETFSSLACPWPGSSSYFPSSRSRETFLSSNRRLLSTISSQVCTVETLPPTSVTVRSTRRTKLTRKLSKHAGGWNGNTAQLGGGGDGGEGGGDGVGGGDGGDGGGEGGGHLYTDCSASRSIPGG